MATNTPRINLVKPDGTDLVDIAVINSNYDKIDANIASTKIQATKPSTANAGDLWWDSNTGTLYLYYTDANSSQWVAATSDPVNIGVVANQSERDAQYPTPGQGMRVYRTDLGVTQTYYGLFNASTNPGGRDVAGWYDTEKNVALVPIRPASTAFFGGSGSVTAMGQVRFTNCTNVQIDGIFSSQFDNYHLVLTTINPDSHVGYYRFVTNGSQISTSAYSFQMLELAGSTNAVGFRQITQPQGRWCYSVGGTRTESTFTVYAPNISQHTTMFNSVTSGNPNASQAWLQEAVGYYNANDQFTGIAFFPQIGSITGTLSIYGYND